MSATYEPPVTEIINNKQTDNPEIEYILDALPGFCFDDDQLLLYRKPCSDYFDLKPQATADYINSYREMWDEEGKMNFKKKSR